MSTSSYPCQYNMNLLYITFKLAFVTQTYSLYKSVNQICNARREHFSRFLRKLGGLRSIIFGNVNGQIKKCRKLIFLYYTHWIKAIKKTLHTLTFVWHKVYYFVSRIYLFIIIMHGTFSMITYGIILFKMFKVSPYIDGM